MGQIFKFKNKWAHQVPNHPQALILKQVGPIQEVATVVKKTIGLPRLDGNLCQWLEKVGLRLEESYPLD